MRMPNVGTDRKMKKAYVPPAADSRPVPFTPLFQMTDSGPFYGDFRPPPDAEDEQ